MNLSRPYRSSMFTSDTDFVRPEPLFGVVSEVSKWANVGEVEFVMMSWSRCCFFLGFSTFSTID